MVDKKVDKVMVTGRVPSYVKKYCEKNNITISKLLMKGFDEFRSTDREHAMSRLNYHEERVLHWRQIVLQQQEECNTKVQFCNTVRETFQEQGRGTPETKRLDMSWINAKTLSLQKKGVVVTPDELYEFCIREVNK